MTTNSTQGATAKPWRYALKYGDPHKHAVMGPRHAEGGDYAPLARLSEQADAMLIVRAVNSHTQLVAALKEAARFIDSSSAYNTVAINKIIKSALAAAGGGK